MGQFCIMPFNLRSMDDEKKARMGVHECVTHKLIEPFQVLFDKEGAHVALYKSEKSLEDGEILKLLKTSANPKAAKKKKKAAERAVSDETATGEDAVPALVEQQ